MKTLMQQSKLVSVFLITTCISTATFAFGGHHSKGISDALNLTQAQQETIAELRESKKDFRGEYKEQFKALKQEKRELLKNYDEEKANQIAQKEAEIHKQRVLKRLEFQTAMYAILDEDQKAQFMDMVDSGPKGFHGKGKKMHHDKMGKHPKFCE